MKEQDFKRERNLVGAMELVLGAEPIENEFEPAAAIRDCTSQYLCNVKQALSVLDYIEKYHCFGDLCTFVTFYSNYVAPRPAAVVCRMIKDCFSYDNYSMQSIGIDMVALHCSSPDVRQFLDLNFNHPYLQKKMEQLRQEIKELTNEN